jgi:IclR family acetate operon transcriptional repressor
MAQATIQSVERAFEVLDHLAQGPANLATISQAVGVSAPGTLKMMKTLELLGMIRQLADKRYELAVGCGRYASAYCQQNPLRELARPVMEALSLETGDRIVLAVLQGERQVTLLAVDPRLGWRHPELEIPSGPHLSLQLATGRVLLAHAPGGCARQQYEAYPHPPAGLASFDEVGALLEDVRQADYAVVPTAQFHMQFLGVPVRDRAGHVVAALGVHVTEPETIEHALGLARQAAVQIAKSLVS